MEHASSVLYIYSQKRKRRTCIIMDNLVTRETERVREMLEDEINKESNVEALIVGGDDYTILIAILLLLIAHILSASKSLQPLESANFY